MGAPRAPYMAKTDKERLATGFWNRIESNQATDCNTSVIQELLEIHFDTVAVDEFGWLWELRTLGYTSAEMA